ncbi:Exopolyphosphatase [Blastocladiella emersonii ATCC 22665]|nr:Exopolyphosphatase [Blastocladiella emersonii ATCC 22665]
MKEQMSCPTVRAFLAQARARILAGERPAWVVLGNEAADLDSAIASLIYAYGLHLATGAFAVPALPIPLADLPLRTEVTAFLDDGLLPWSTLLTSEDLSVLLPLMGPPPGTHVALVDFNVLPPSLQHVSPAVSAILDHHADGGHFPAASPRVVEVVGSATSLVVRHFREVFDRQPAAVKAEIGALALGPIVVDTVNFDPAMARATPVDVTATEWCMAAAGTDVAHRTALFERLNAAKLAIAHLATRDLLRKDYKEYELNGAGGRYGISSVTWDLDAWRARDGAAAVAKDAREYLSQRELRALFIFTAFTDARGAFARQLAVVAPESGIADRIVAGIQAGAPEVQLEVARDPEDVLPVHSVRNLKMSRKLFQPLLHRVLLARL